MPEYPLDIDVLVQSLPEKPGVYLFKDSSDKILYVGKARDLRKRVLSYLLRGQDLPERTRLLVRGSAGLDIVVTNTESEAFILERNLIKKNMPKYNIVLRDDKQYPLLRIDTKEAFPSICVVRRVKKDGALYFGPYSSANSMRETLRVIHKAFPLRKCKGGLKPRSRPCINYQMKRCLGPCVGLVSEGEYRSVLLEAIQFLEGKSRPLIEVLRSQMLKASEAMEFERAGILRDRIRAIEKALEPQAVVSPLMEDKDVIGISSGKQYTHVVVLKQRNGILQDTVAHRMKGASTMEEGLEAFLKQHYPEVTLLPPLIVLPTRVEDAEGICLWLKEVSQRDVKIREPKSRPEKRLMRMAIENARRLMEEEERANSEVLLEIQRDLMQTRYPRRIECVDISHAMGSKAVGAVVCFVDGRPFKKGYRSYIIRDVKGIDDYQMMREVVKRRLLEGEPPDLLLLDGGKGHLASIEDLLRTELHVGELPFLAAIAKARDLKVNALDPAEAADDMGGVDKVYIPGRKNPLNLSPATLHLLMSIRDEAHRRAIGHHRKKMRHEVRASLLDGIPGIGPKKKALLLKEFMSIEGLRAASVEELSSLKGITEELARRILDALRDGRGPGEENGI